MHCSGDLRRTHRDWRGPPTYRRAVENAPYLRFHAIQLQNAGQEERLHSAEYFHPPGMIVDGVVANYTELARLGSVSRARISQIMRLLNVAPDLQEAILCMAQSLCGQDPMTLAEWLAVAA